MRRTMMTILGVMAVLAAAAQVTLSEIPLISMHTNLYDTYGEDNAFTLVVAGTPGAYIDVDCGYGPVKYQLELGGYDSESQTLSGTFIPCQVSEQGIVNIYGDPGTIDYFNGDGCAISTIDFADPEALVILSLNHNELETLDLSAFNHLQALYLTDNPFDKGGLTIGPDKPMLQIIEMSIIDNLDPAFNLSDYPQIRSFDSMHNPSLTRLDPTGCPGLLRLSIDLTNVSSLDLSKNEYLAILNISDTAIREIDLSNNTYLQELYATHMSGTFNPDVKLNSIDLSVCPDLVYLFLQGNNLTDIDLSNNPKLDHLWLQDNQLTNLDLSHNPMLTSVRIERNNMDFATLPENPGTWNEYEYAQRPMPLPKSYLRGAEIDLASRVMRPGTETYCAVFKLAESDPEQPIEIPEALYKFDKGILKINASVTDSVFVAFGNSMFPAAALTTTKFRIKNQDQMGAPDQKVAFAPMLSAGEQLALTVGIDGASEQTPKNVYVDFGDGTLVAFPVSTVTMPATPNVEAPMPGTGMVRVYVDEGEVLTAFAIDGVALSSIDFSQAPQLRDLRLVGTGLYDLNLEWCRCLQRLQVNGNHLSTFSLAGNNPSYGKNVLEYIDVSDNEIDIFEKPENVGTMRHLDVSHNNIPDIDFTDCEALEYVDVSYNQFTRLKVNYGTSMTWLDASHNLIEDYVEPETNVLRSLNLAYNRLTLPTLPVRGKLDDYIYAPQAVIEIPKKGPGVDISDQNIEVDGEWTRFDWVRTDGTPLAVGTEVICEGGVTSFIDPSVGEVYCRISHPAFPEFSGDDVLRTSVIEAVPRPTYVAAEFVTKSAQQVQLSLAATEPTTICIDWNGDGATLEQYTLGTTYTLYTAQTVPGRKVRVYSYDEQNNISVFSITGAAMESFDGTNLRQVTTLSVNAAGLSEITLPDAPIQELSLSGNEFESFDLSAYPDLIIADFGGNLLTSIDVSANPSLMLLYAPNNRIETVDFGVNPNLWMVVLDGNRLGDIDLSGLPGLEQVALHNNQLSQIDISANPALRMLTLDNNRFTLASLPEPSKEWLLYTYAPQAPIDATCVDGRVDLATQAKIGGKNTEYRWFIDYPEVNEEDELEGDELVAGEAYDVSGGFTTFHGNFTDVVGVLTNPLFPRLWLYTTMMTVTAAGIEDVDADSTAPIVTTDGLRINVVLGGEASLHHGDVVALYTLTGIEVAVASPAPEGTAVLTAPAPGAYILCAGPHSQKIILN